MIDLFDLGVIAFIYYLITWLNNRDQKKIDKQIKDGTYKY